MIIDNKDYTFLSLKSPPQYVMPAAAGWESEAWYEDTKPVGWIELDDEKPKMSNLPNTENTNKLMNIYLLDRTDKVDYDQYDSFVVVAKSPKQARDYVRSIHKPDRYSCDCWSDDNKAQLIGTTDKYVSPEIILGSFNAG
jgi:hypothetical protein